MTTEKESMDAVRAQVELCNVVNRLLESGKLLRQERDKLQKFKEYVHRRLDIAGVPTHPNGVHSAEGCRIGDRLDKVLVWYPVGTVGERQKERDQFLAQIALLEKQLADLGARADDLAQENRRLKQVKLKDFNEEAPPPRPLPPHVPGFMERYSVPRPHVYINPNIVNAAMQRAGEQMERVISGRVE